MNNSTGRVQDSWKVLVFLLLLLCSDYIMSRVKNLWICCLMLKSYCRVLNRFWGEGAVVVSSSWVRARDTTTCGGGLVYLLMYFAKGFP